MNATKPLLFLDFEGVLNCSFGENRVVIRSDTIGLIAAVPNDTDRRIGVLLEHFEPVWATSHGVRVHDLLREYLSLPVEPWPYIRCGGGAWKLPEIVKYAAGRRWAWLDDDIKSELLYYDRPLPPDNAGLPCKVERTVGITDEHVAQLLEFASAG